MNSRRRVKITESDLHRIVRESVDRVLYEGPFDKMKAMWNGAQDGKELYDIDNKIKGYYGGGDALEYKIAEKVWHQIANKYSSRPAVMEYLKQLFNEKKY